MWLASPVLLGFLACNPAGTADERLAQGLPEQAVALYADADELTDAQRQRYARALLQTDAVEGARRQLDQVATLDATGLLVRGALHARAGELKSALTDFEAGYALSPMPELAHDICTTRLALDDEPIPACTRSVEVNPQSALAYAALAEAAARSGADQAAREALAAAVGHLDAEPQAAAWVAEGWRRVGEDGAACDLYALAQTVDIGLACLAEGQVARAIDVLEPLGDTDQRAAAGMLRARVEGVEVLGASAAKAIAIERAARWDRRLVDSQDAQVLYDRGRLARADGEALAAETLWRQAVTEAPCTVEPWLALIDGAQRRGQPTEPLFSEALAACSVPFFQQVVETRARQVDPPAQRE
ncbi:MAG: hypothetical protein GY884_14200 [Proteobacteria bacterium]|nr:hypothetical protein [Pseudomonadota bacterium]